MEANAAETLARLIVPMLGMMSVMLARFWPHGTLRSVANGAVLVLLLMVGLPLWTTCDAFAPGIDHFVVAANMRRRVATLQARR